MQRDLGDKPAAEGCEAAVPGPAGGPAAATAMAGLGVQAFPGAGGGVA